MKSFLKGSLKELTDVSFKRKISESAQNVLSVTLPKGNLKRTEWIYENVIGEKEFLEMSRQNLVFTTPLYIFRSIYLIFTL